MAPNPTKQNIRKRAEVRIASRLAKQEYPVVKIRRTTFQEIERTAILSSKAKFFARINKPRSVNEYLSWGVPLPTPRVPTSFDLVCFSDDEREIKNKDTAKFVREMRKKKVVDSSGKLLYHPKKSDVVGERRLPIDDVLSSIRTEFPDVNCLNSELLYEILKLDSSDIHNNGFTNLYNFRLSILPIRDNNNNFKFVTIDPRDEVLTSWGLPKSTGVSVLNKIHSLILWSAFKNDKMELLQSFNLWTKEIRDENFETSFLSQN